MEMSWKSVAKSFVPPIALKALDLIRNYKHGTRPGNIWEGIYDDYAQVPRSGGAFEGDVWLEGRRRSLEKERREENDLSSFIDENALLPFLVSIIGLEERPVRILDFGGGLGESYLDTKRRLKERFAIDYHIVETARMCEEGTALFESQDGIQFHDSLPSEMSDLDVVYVSSALQYVEDYAALLRRLCAYRPRFILFVKLSSGDIPTYATAQKNVRGSTIPYWFINIQELLQIMSAGGYALIFKSVLEREYDQDNFPEEYRLRRACNLLFGRTPGTGA